MPQGCDERYAAPRNHISCVARPRPRRHNAGVNEGWKSFDNAINEESKIYPNKGQRGNASKNLKKPSRARKKRVSSDDDDSNIESSASSSEVSEGHGENPPKKRKKRKKAVSKR